MKMLTDHKEGSNMMVKVSIPCPDNHTASEDIDALVTPLKGLVYIYVESQMFIPGTLEQ